MFLEYLKENPILTAVLAASLAVIFIVIVAMVVKNAKAKKKNASDAASADETNDTNALSSASEEKETCVRPAYEAAPEAIGTQPIVPVGETSAEEPAPAAQTSETSAEAEAEERPEPIESGDESESGEKTAHATEKNEESEVMQATALETDEANKEDNKTEEAKIEEPAAECAREESPAVADVEKKEESEEKKTEDKEKNDEKTVYRETKKGKNKSKEDKMNIEDLKNAIEDEADFYDEDDENERIARYSGKWVICRVVTVSDKNADELPAEGAGEETFFFELHASNGEKLLTSEEYTTYNGAINGIETHKSNIERGNFKIMLSKKGDYIFKLLSGKNMLLCMGEHYATKTRCESAIESTKRFARTAILDENVQDIIVTPPPEDDETEALQIPDNGYNGKWIIRAHTADDGEQVFYFELLASNGEKLLSSEEYTTYIGAINGIGTHKTNIERGNFRISLTKRGDYIYKLLNGNGQLLCLGEHYRTKRRCENAIESVKRFAKNAPILADPETVNKNA